MVRNSVMKCDCVRYIDGRLSLLGRASKHPARYTNIQVYCVITHTSLFLVKFIMGNLLHTIQVIPIK